MHMIDSILATVVMILDTALSAHIAYDMIVLIIIATAMLAACAGTVIFVGFECLQTRLKKRLAESLSWVTW